MSQKRKLNLPVLPSVELSSISPDNQTITFPEYQEFDSPMYGSTPEEDTSAMSFEMTLPECDGITRQKSINTDRGFEKYDPAHQHGNENGKPVAGTNKKDGMWPKSKASRKRTRPVQQSKGDSKKQKRDMDNPNTVEVVKHTKQASNVRLTKQNDSASEVVLEEENNRLLDLPLQWDILSPPMADGYSAEPVSQKTVSILDYIKQEGRESNKVKEYLETSRLRCKDFFTDNDRVWAAYEPSNKDVPVIVAEVKKRIHGAPEYVGGCRIVQLVEEEEVASAAEGFDDNKRNKKLNFSEKEIIDLRKCMDQNTDRLIKSHSNILAVMGSDIILHDKRKEMEDRTCVVIYVRTKRFIPFYEEQFTLDNNDFPLDVREGRGLTLVSRLKPKEYVKSVRMGCKIDSDYGSGTLTGFVELPDGKIACLTAWHIFDTGEGDHTATLLNSDRFKKNVYQPCRSQDHKYKIGSVINVSEDFDAALIEIDEPERLPRSGHFPNAICPEKGFPSSNPMKFDTGDIINCQTELDSKMSCTVVKYGAVSETTFGNIGHPGITFRLKLPNDRGYYLKKPIFVCTELGETFSEEGDSGSLVFIKDDEKKELRAIGMVVGKLDSANKDLTVVMPIWEILQSFDLPLRLLSFEEPWNIGFDQLQAQMKEIRQQLAQISDMTKKTEVTVKEVYSRKTKLK